jgi:hypothetical protein
MGVKVKREMCETCIFRPGNPMRLRPGRVQAMVEECEANDSYITCHDTLEIVTGSKQTEAMCRGYLDAGPEGHWPQMLRIAERLNAVEEV